MIIIQIEIWGRKAKILVKKSEQLVVMGLIFKNAHLITYFQISSYLDKHYDILFTVYAKKTHLARAEGERFRVLQRSDLNIEHRLATVLVLVGR